MINQLQKDVYKRQTYTYKRGLVDGDFSYASAVEMMQSVVNFVILISVNKFSKKFSDTSLW